MVNSDQVWRKENYFNLDVGFLKFSHNWNIKKFIYGASLGLEFWPFNKNEDRILKHLFNNFIFGNYKKIRNKYYLTIISS